MSARVATVMEVSRRALRPNLPMSLVSPSRLSTDTAALSARRKPTVGAVMPLSVAQTGTKAYIRSTVVSTAARTASALHTPGMATSQRTRDGTHV